MNPWVAIASLLAKASGLSHDIGKATIHFQSKLRHQGNHHEADRVRHEWVSVRVLETWRTMMREWRMSALSGNQAPKRPTLADAWPAMAREGIERIPGFMQHHLKGNRMIKEVVVSPVHGADGVIDFAVVTHHGLLGPINASGKHDKSVIPLAETHVRSHIDQPIEDFERMPDDLHGFSGDLEAELWDTLQHIDEAASTLTEEQDDALYWKGIGLMVRLALIAADHQVSSRTMPPVHDKPEDGARLYANTKPAMRNSGRYLDQTLDWHLEHVGKLASEWVSNLACMNGLYGLDERGRALLRQESSDPRFLWQQEAVRHIRQTSTDSQHHPAPRLVLNSASTGTGKTRANLMIADAMTPDDRPLRVSIGLNLRSLTLQTGDSICADIGLSRDDVATLMGDTFLKAAHDASRSGETASNEDEDETNPQDGTWTWDVSGRTPRQCPEWMNEWAETYGGCNSGDRTRTLLATPVLVSTIDYLIDAGNPGRQGHHVTSALRVAGSDLILDEVDNYSPKALGAVMRLVEMAALMGRNVVISSATMTQDCASAVVRAFDQGCKMNAAINHQAYTGCNVTLIDNYQAPLSFTGTPCDINAVIANRLNGLSNRLQQEPCYRLAFIQEIHNGQDPLSRFCQSIETAARHLHASHAWTHPSGKRVSFGVVRVANIEPCVEVASRLQCVPGLIVTAYHSEDFRLRRWVKECALDRIFNRKSGNEKILSDPDMDWLIRESTESELTFIVVATPVEEVGRDHDFDWAIIEPSSAASIVQLAGRVNRHRRTEVCTPNIAILDHNLRSLKGYADCFKYPGNEKSYPANGQAMRTLLTGAPGWSDQGLVITPALVFGHDGATCELAEDDQKQTRTILSGAEAQILSGQSLSKNALAWLTRRHYIDFNLRHDPQPTVRFRARYDDHSNLYFEAYAPVEHQPLSRFHARWRVTDNVKIQENRNQGCWGLLSPTLEQLPGIASAMGLDEYQSMEIALRDQDGVVFVIDERYGRAKSIRI